MHRPESFTYRLKAPKRFSCIQVLLLACVLFASSPARAQSQSPVIDRGRGKEMLQSIKEALKELYYDPRFHGMDVEARFKKAERQIGEAKSTWQINTIIAQVLLELDDSHTRFAPPDLELGVDFGFQMQMLSDTCYVVRVKQGSDAEAKGLKVGDIVHAVEGYGPTRESLWKITYSYFVLLPPPSLRLTLRAPNGRLSELMVEAAVTKKKRNKVEAKEGTRNPPEFYDLSDDVIVCKLSRFDLSDKEVDEMMKRIKPRKALILDLRGNPGGAVSMEQRLLGHFFDRDVVIGEEKERNKTSTRVAKSRGRGKAFSGSVFVLVDSGSMSAAEVFARVMQLEKRGTVIGDRTAGAVQTSIHATFAFQTAAGWQATPSSFYGASITVADLVMSDGKSLEKTGVTPDQLVLPIAGDLAGRRDPALAHAASLAGVPLDAEKAGTIFRQAQAGGEEDRQAKGRN